MSLEGLYFSVVRLQEGVDLGQRGGRGEVEGVEGGESAVRIHCMRKV